ncbi:MAG: glycosyltransferase [Isosphaeraceae bacterium]
MKILALNNGYPPEVHLGNETRTRILVDALRAAGHETIVLTSAPSAVIEAEKHVHRQLHLTEEWSPSLLGHNPIHQRALLARSRFVETRNVAALGRVIDEVQPDVAYLGDLVGLGGLGLVLTLQHLGVPWVWRWEGDPSLRLCRLQGPVIPGLAREFSKRLQGAYLVASDAARRLGESSGLRLNGRVERVPYWIAGNRPRRRSFHAPGDLLRIVAVGGARRGAALERLAGAARRLIDGGDTNFQIDVLGPIEHHGPLALVASEGLIPHLRLIGERPGDQAGDHFGRYDALAFPAERAESLGAVPVNASAFGCVPILSGPCEASEWLVHGVHCLKTPPTAEGLALALRSILRGEIDLGAIARRASETAWRDFHVDALLPRIENVLCQVRGQKTAPVGRFEDALRLARIAERLSLAWIEESLSAG